MTDAISCIISLERNNMQVSIYFHNGERIWLVVIEMYWSETKNRTLNLKRAREREVERGTVNEKENERGLTDDVEFIIRTTVFGGDYERGVRSKLILAFGQRPYMGLTS